MLLQIILPKGNQEVQFEGINELKELSQKHWHDAPQYTLYSFSFTFFEGPKSSTTVRWCVVSLQ